MSERVKKIEKTRNEVLEKFENRCVICGIDKNIQDCHIASRSTHPEFSFILSNRVPLCANHHTSGLDPQFLKKNACLDYNIDNTHRSINDRIEWLTTYVLDEFRDLLIQHISELIDNLQRNSELSKYIDKEFEKLKNGKLNLLHVIEPTKIKNENQLDSELFKLAENLKRLSNMRIIASSLMNNLKRERDRRTHELLLSMDSEFLRKNSIVKSDKPHLIRSMLNELNYQIDESKSKMRYIDDIQSTYIETINIYKKIRG